MGRDRPAPRGTTQNEKVPARDSARAGCLTKATTMMETELSGQEPDASTANQRPTSEADSESVETVHRANGWRLTVRKDGSVETHEMGATRLSPVTTRDEWFGMERENYRCGKTIEGVISRYAHETRFDRDPNEGEHGAALRNGIISALQSVATDATCGRTECDSEATHVRHVNAPTGPSTTLVCDWCASEGTYVTLYALDEGEREAKA
jgi:hypothetical protein